MSTDAPERFTNAWYREQLSGITHLQRLQAAKQAALEEDLSAAIKRLCEMERLDAEKTAKIGELNARLEEIEAKHETMAKWLREKFGKQGAAA